MMLISNQKQHQVPLKVNFSQVSHDAVLQP